MRRVARKLGATINCESRAGDCWVSMDGSIIAGWESTVARRASKVDGALTKGDRRGCSDGLDLGQFEQLLSKWGIAGAHPSRPAARSAVCEHPVDCLVNFDSDRCGKLVSLPPKGGARANTVMHHPLA